MNDILRKFAYLLRALKGAAHQAWNCLRKDTESELHPDVWNSYLENFRRGFPTISSSTTTDRTSGRFLWVVPPFNQSSGGMWTIVRAAKALEGKGIGSTFLIHGTSRDRTPSYYRHILSRSFGLEEADVQTQETIVPERYDAVIATSWETVFIAVSMDIARKVYFVQDYEPDFHPAGTARELASLTYQCGFEIVTVGPFLSGKISKAYGIECKSIPLPYDESSFYLPAQEGNRSSRRFVFYQRKSTPRRLSEIGIEAMLILNSMLDGSGDIFVVGKGPVSARSSGLKVLGRHLETSEFRELLWTTQGVLSLSATNTSLLPLEALACGAAVVTNDSAANRSNLSNLVRFEDLHPESLAGALRDACRPRSQELERLREHSWSLVGPKLADLLVTP